MVSIEQVYIVKGNECDDSYGNKFTIIPNRLILEDGDMTYLHLAVRCKPIRKLFGANCAVMIQKLKDARNRKVQSTMVQNGQGPQTDRRWSFEAKAQLPDFVSITEPLAQGIVPQGVKIRTSWKRSAPLEVEFTAGNIDYLRAVAKSVKIETEHKSEAEHKCEFEHKSEVEHKSEIEHHKSEVEHKSEIEHEANTEPAASSQCTLEHKSEIKSESPIAVAKRTGCISDFFAKRKRS